MPAERGKLKPGAPPAQTKLLQEIPVEGWLENGIPVGQRKNVLLMALLFGERTP